MSSQDLNAGEVNLFVSGGGSEYCPNHEVPQSGFGESSSGFMTGSLRGNEQVMRFIDNRGNLSYPTKQLFYQEGKRVMDRVCKSAKLIWSGGDNLLLLRIAV